MGIGDKIMGTVHRRKAGDWYCLRYDPERFYYNDRFKLRPGVLTIAPELRAWASQLLAPSPPAVLIEPHIKGEVSGANKDWGWSRWLELAASSPLPLLQPDYGKPILPGVASIATPTFEHACALLEASRGIVTTNGGLHTAAGALRKPAVVIFGGFAPAKLLGYPFHENLEAPEPACLGRRQTDEACARAMARITVAEVLEAMARAFPS